VDIGLILMQDPPQLGLDLSSGTSHTISARFLEDLRAKCLSKAIGVVYEYH